MIRAAVCIFILLVGPPDAAQGQTADATPPRSSSESSVKAKDDARRTVTPSPTPEKDDAGPLRFRRVFVPQAELLDRVKRQERYVPMDAADFEARLRRLRGAGEQAQETGAGISYATYSAELDNTFRLIGTGAWHITIQGKTPALLPLTGLGLALREPRWAPLEVSSSTSPAKLGASEDGEAALYANRSGSVIFDWSLAGSQDRDRRWTYELALPACAAHRIELTLPADLTPAIEGAIISEPMAVGAEKRRWTIDLAGRSTGSLRLWDRSEQGSVKALALYRPKLTYELSRQGLQLSAEWQIDVHGEPVKSIDVDVDAELTLLSATSGGTVLGWSESAGAADSGAKRVILRFPEPLHGTNRLVRLIATAPLKIHPAWKLPSVSARDLVWQDGTMALVVARPLTLERLDLLHCRQTKRESLPAPAAGEAIGIQAFGPAATVTVHAAPREEYLELKSGATIELFGNEAIGSYVAEISARQGERFELSANISPEWIVDSVQSSPADMIADWDRQRGDGTTTRLVIHLARSVSRDRPLRLLVRATRRRAVLGDTLGAEDLRLLTFDNVVPVRRLVQLTTASSYRLELSGAEDLTRLDPVRLDTADRSLLGDSLAGQLFLNDEFASDLQVRVLPERPRFSAALATRVVLGERHMEESHEIRVSPESNELDQVIIHLSQARSAELAWSLTGGGELMSSRRLTGEEQVALGIGDSGETWEVRFQVPRTAPFVLVASRRNQIQGDVPLALPSLLHTTSQQGNVSVELASEFIPQLVERRLKILAIEPAARGAYQNVLAAYEYDPTEDLLVAKEPALVLKIDRQPAHRRPAWVWRSTFEAWFSPSRSVQYRARFFIENAGRSHVSIALSPDEPAAGAPEVEIDGATANEMTWDEESGELQVTLPAGRRYCVVEVAWSEKKPALGGISTRTLSWPTVDVPILGRKAAVWLPIGYVLANTADTHWPSQTTPVGWRQRLFGPLGRPGDRETFEPWLADDWLRTGGEPTVDDLSQLSPPDAALRQPPQDVWFDLADAEGSIWQTVELDLAHNMPPDSWTAYPLGWSANENQVRLLIVRRQMLVALSVGLFLISAGVFWRLSRRSAMVQIVALGVVVIIALLLPAVLAALGTAAVLGFVGGKLCRWLFPLPTPNSSIDIAVQPVAASVASILILAWLWAPPVVAQEPSDAETKTESPTVYDVLIPIDDQERVTGDKVFVPETLYRALLARTGGDPKGHRYLITSADYEGIGQATLTDGQPFAPRGWRASLTVEVLQSPARVLLPLGKKVQIVPDSGRLDGRPLQFGWIEEQESFYFDVNETGVAKVEFELRPAGAGDSPTREVSFAIPRVPQSSLRLQVSDPTQPPRILAVGGARMEPGAKQVVAALGPIGQVSIASSGATSRTESTAQFDSDELTWLRVRPGSAVLNARFSVQVRRGAVSELSLWHDDRLLSVPLAGNALIETIVRVSDNESRLRLAQPITDRAVIELAFVVKGMSGPGRFLWPRVELPGAATSRRRIACSVDPSLELVSSPAAGVKPLNSAQFAALWGEGDARPLAYELAASTVDWLLDVRTRQASLASSYRSRLVVNPAHAPLQWDAAIDITGGSRYQIRAAVPPGFDVDHVEVRDDAGVRPSRWALSDARTLTVFLDAAATGRLELLVRGQLTVNKVNHLTVPLLEVEGSTTRKATLIIMRRASVTASIVEQANLRELGTAEAEAELSDVDWGASDGHATSPRLYLLAAFEAKSARGPIVLAVQTNAPRVDAVQAMSLARQGDAWQAVLDLKLFVSGGVLDAVRIETPASWSAPFRIEPDVPHQVLDVPGESRRQLLLYPPRPLAGEAQFRIEGRLSPTAGQRVRAPDARVLGAVSLQQFFALPLQQDLQSLAWETRGLKPESIPEGLVQARPGRETVQTFLRASDQFRAELRSVEKIADDVQVRLADFAVSFSRDGACYGAAAFDIEPAGRSSCRLALPAGSRLVQLSVDGRPLRLSPAGELRWQVPLSGGRLPQRIEIVYTGQLASDAARSPIIEGPKLIGLPVERTLWTVSAPGIGGAAAANDVEPLTPLVLEATRYESVAGLIESAAGTLSEVALEETPRFYAAWAQRMMASRQSLERLQMLARPSEFDQELTEKIELVDQDQHRLAERLGTHDILDLLWDDPPRGQSPVAAWTASQDRPHGSWQGMFLGEASTIPLSYADQATGELASQVLSVLVAAALLLIAVAAVRYTTVLQWLSDRPRFIVLAVGLFWWLFLWPSAAGWVVVLAAAFLPYLSRFGRRIIRRPVGMVHVA